ncbi:MAG: hypothetical protein ABFD89_29340 [Bryobacteraceae bacterium]
MRGLRNAPLALLLVALVAVPVFGQTALTSTTFSAAVAEADDVVNVASATGITAPAVGQSVNSILIAGPEAMRVRAVSGTRITVERGYGTRVYAHASGSKVYEATAGELAPSEPYGTCTAGTSWPYTPLLVVGTGRTWTCIASTWVSSPLVSVGAAATGITVTERGDGSRHVTKLTFADLELIAPVGAASLAAGKLLYTLPSGVVVIHAVGINVALTGSGATCDADTPDLGMGTVIGTGAVATLDGTATFENILTGQTVSNLTGTAAIKTLASAPLAIESAGAHTVHLNIADGWAGACTVTGTGTVYLEWSVLE